MKKIIWFVLIICSAVFLFACTLIQNLMVVNSSDEEIEVLYEKKDFSVYPLEVTSESNFNKWGVFQKDWDKMPTEQYSFSEDKKTVKVKMKSREVVKVGWGDPYYFKKGDDSHLNLKTLKIKGNNKKVYFENSAKLLNEFKKNDYQIIYR